jgi:hypothetical protein
MAPGWNIWRTTAPLVAALLALLVTAVSLASAAGEEFTTTTELRTATWRILQIDGEQVLTLGIESGTCGAPEIDHVEVRRKPMREGKVPVVITVWERFTVYHHPPTPPGSHVTYACAGVGLQLVKRIKLSASVDNLVLYDGGTTPPQRRPICEPPPGRQPAPPRGPVGVTAAVPVCWHRYSGLVPLRHSSGR